MNGARFRAYVEQVLVPTLRPGDTVKVMARRAEEALAGRPGTFGNGQGDAKPGNAASPTAAHLATDPATLAKQSPAERLAQTAPAQSQGGAGAGRSGPPIASTIHVHQAGNPEHTANEVSRRLQDLMNYQTTDLPTHV